MKRISVILPSRGLIFAETEAAIEKERRFYDIEVFRSSNLTLPHSQNYLTKKALEESGAGYLLFIEEDVVLPDNGLFLLFSGLERYKADITCIDYGVNGYSCTAKNRANNEVLWCGLGCTLVKRRVFEALEYPYFRDDKKLRLNDFEWTDVPEHRRAQEYGGQDIRFCMMAREKGFKIMQIPGVEAKHLKLEVLGQPERNHGLHLIQEKPRITEQQWVDVPEEEISLTESKKLDTVNIVGNHIPTLSR